MGIEYVTCAIINYGYMHLNEKRVYGLHKIFV